jgi:hypothetical protein
VGEKIALVAAHVAVMRKAMMKGQRRQRYFASETRSQAPGGSHRQEPAPGRVWRRRQTRCHRALRARFAAAFLSGARTSLTAWTAR